MFILMLYAILKYKVSKVHLTNFSNNYNFNNFDKYGDSLQRGKDSIKIIISDLKSTKNKTNG